MRYEREKEKEKAAVIKARNKKKTVETVMMMVIAESWHEKKTVGYARRAVHFMVTP